MQHQIASEVSNAFHSMFDDFLKGLFEGLGVIANTMWPDKSKEIEERIARVVAAILKRQEERRKANMESQSKIDPLPATTVDLHDITDGNIPAVDTYKLSEDPVRKVGIIEARLANGKATTLEVQRGDTPTERLMQAAIAAAQHSINSGVHTIHIVGPKGCDGHIFDEAGRRLTNQTGGGLTVSRGTDVAVKWDKNLSAKMPGIAQPAAKVAAAQTAAPQVQEMAPCLAERERLETLMGLTAVMAVAKAKGEEDQFEKTRKEFAALLTDEEKTKRIEDYNKKAAEFGRPSFEELPVEHKAGTGPYAIDQSTYFEPSQYWTDVFVEKGEANNAKIEAAEHVVAKTESETPVENPKAGAPVAGSAQAKAVDEFAVKPAESEPQNADSVAQSESPKEEEHAEVEPAAGSPKVEEVAEVDSTASEPQNAAPEVEEPVPVKDDPFNRHWQATKEKLNPQEGEEFTAAEPEAPAAKSAEVEPVAVSHATKQVAEPEVKLTEQEPQTAAPEVGKSEPVEGSPVATPESASEVEAPKAEESATVEPVAEEPAVEENAVQPAAESEAVEPIAPEATPAVEQSKESEDVVVRPSFIPDHVGPEVRPSFGPVPAPVEQVPVQAETPRHVPRGPAHGCIRKPQ